MVKWHEHLGRLADENLQIDFDCIVRQGLLAGRIPEEIEACFEVARDRKISLRLPTSGSLPNAKLDNRLLRHLSFTLDSVTEEKATAYYLLEYMAARIERLVYCTPLCMGFMRQIAHREKETQAAFKKEGAFISADYERFSRHTQQAFEGNEQDLFHTLAWMSYGEHRQLMATVGHSNTLMCDVTQRINHMAEHRLQNRHAEILELEEKTIEFFRGEARHTPNDLLDVAEHLIGAFSRADRVMWHIAGVASTHQVGFHTVWKKIEGDRERQNALFAPFYLQWAELSDILDDYEVTIEDSLAISRQLSEAVSGFYDAQTRLIESHLADVVALVCESAPNRWTTTVGVHAGQVLMERLVVDFNHRGDTSFLDVVRAEMHREEGLRPQLWLPF